MNWAISAISLLAEILLTIAVVVMGAWLIITLWQRFGQEKPKQDSFDQRTDSVQNFMNKLVERYKK